MPWKPGVEAEDQDRFKTAELCKYYDLFKIPGDRRKTLNDWKIICSFKAKKGNCETEHKAIKQVFLDVIEQRMSETIRRGNIGALETVDAQYDGYYLVRWVGQPYTLTRTTELWKGEYAQKGAIISQGNIFPQGEQC